MPNWTHNTLSAPTEVLKKYIEHDETGDPFFDFNKVVKMPKIYSDPGLSSGFDTDWCIYWFLSECGKYKKVIESVFGYKISEKMTEYCSAHSVECYNRGRKYVNAVTKYGFKSWYGWSVENWGTKWNACDSVFDDKENPTKVTFETAWCYPKPIIEKIMAENPECFIEFTWENEDYDGTHYLLRGANGVLEEGMEWIESHLNGDIDD